MPKLPLFLAGLALVVVWLLYAQWAESTAQTPEILLATASERILEGTEDPDYDSALHELEIALAMAEADENRDLIEEILDVRAELYSGVGATAPAIQDFRRLLDEFRPEDESLQLTLASLHQREGNAVASLALVRSVLERDPTHSNALVQLGKLHADEANQLLADCDKVLYRSLPESVDAHGHELARRVASRDNLDPTRVALLQELLGLFGPLSNRDSSLTEDLLRRASNSFADAREAFTSAMETRLNPQAYAGFLEILASAGRYREAARFGIAAMAHGGFRADRTAVAALARALARAGDLREAAVVLQDVIRKHMTLEEVHEWALLLYRAEDWDSLRGLVRTLEKRAAKGLPGEPVRRAAAFYDGMVDYQRGRSRTALPRLVRYTKMCDELEEEAIVLPNSVPSSPDLDFEPVEYVELPYVGARAEAHLAIAAMFRRQRQGANELKHLRRVVDLDPDSPGRIWLRIHTLQDKRKIDPKVKVHTLTRVLSSEPDPDGQLIAKWHQIGRAALQADDKDPLDAGGRELRADGQWYPEGDIKPYELYLLAQDHRRAGVPQGSFVCLKRLLEEYPGFRPAQDELIAQLLEARRWDSLGPLLLDRIERWGSTEKLLDVLRAIPDSALELDQRLERMRLDPLHSGVYAMARHLFERGDAQRALDGLLGLGVDRLDSAGRVLTGEILTAQGEHARAVDILFPIAQDDPLYSRATSLRIEASLASEDDELLMSGVRELAGAGGLESGEILRASDFLASQGHLEPALFLLERLDSQPSTRHGSVFLRQAFHHLMAGELTEAEEDLERAEAYIDGAGPLLGRILVAVERGDWKAVPPELGRLRNTDWQPKPLQSIASLALEDRLEDARVLLDSNLEKGQPPHHWLLAAAALSTLQGLSPPGLPYGDTEERREVVQFVTGGPGNSRDARETCILLLALDDPTWRPWVLRRLETLESAEPWALASASLEDASAPETDADAPGASGPASSEPATNGATAVSLPADDGALAADGDEPTRNPLYPFLEGVTLDLLGDTSAATAACHEAVALRPDFAPAWDLLERLVMRTVQRADDPALLIVRQERRTALGQGENNLAEGLLLEAQALAEAGQIDEAITKCQWALREDRRLVHARILMTRLEVLGGKYRAAQQNFDRLFSDLPPEEAAALVPEYVSALERFIERKIVQPTEAARDLAGLARSLPREPDVALALARMELQAAGANVHAGVSRVWRRLEELRSRLEGRSIESYSPDAMRRWYDFAASLDPRRAEQLVRDELELEPASPGLWLMRGEALEAQYKLDEALSQYNALLELFPEKPVLRRVTALMAQRSETPAKIEKLLYDSIDLHGWNLEDVAVRAMLARAYASGGSGHLDTAIGLYEELWSERARFPRGGEPRVADIGQEYGEALLHRALRSDRQRARKVFAEVEPLIVDGPRRDLCRALGHLARYLPVGKPPGKSAKPKADQDAAAEEAAEGSADASQRSAAAAGR